MNVYIVRESVNHTDLHDREDDHEKILGIFSSLKSAEKRMREAFEGVKRDLDNGEVGIDTPNRIDLFDFNDDNTVYAEWFWTTDEYEVED